MRLYLSIGLLSLALISCTQDAPRDNPFDPNSDLYKYAHSLYGEVYRKIPPFEPIVGARIEVQPEGQVTSTDEEGFFRIEHLQHDTVTLQISKRGYGEYSASGSLADFPEQFSLNAQPVMDSIAVVANHISHWWPVEDEFQIIFSAWIRDADGISDIDSVWFAIPDANISLSATGLTENTGMISAFLYDWQMSIPATDLTGLPIYGHVMDIDSLQSEPVTGYTTRFIETAPNPLAPVRNEETGASPALQWEEFDANFTFYYRVQVYRISSGNTATRILDLQEIPKTVNKFSVTDSLANGSYYWTLGVYDIYGNSTHSKEATFTVVE